MPGLIRITCKRTEHFYLDSQLSSWFAFSVYGKDASHPWQTYRHGNSTCVATFSIARLRMLPNEKQFTIKQHGAYFNNIQSISVMLTRLCFSSLLVLSKFCILQTLNRPKFHIVPTVIRQFP